MIQVTSEPGEPGDAAAGGKGEVGPHLAPVQPLKFESL